MAAGLCPGIIFPTPYPEGYGDTLLMPSAGRPTHGVPGSMHEAAPDGNAGWHLQRSGEVTGRFRSSLAVGPAAASWELPCPHHRPLGPLRTRRGEDTGRRGAGPSRRPPGPPSGLPRSRRGRCSGGRRSVVRWSPWFSRCTARSSARPWPREAPPEDAGAVTAVRRLPPRRSGRGGSRPRATAARTRRTNGTFVNRCSRSGRGARRGSRVRESGAPGD